MGLLALPAFAGEIYGSLVLAGKPLAKAAMLATCGGEEAKGETAPDGTYRIMTVKQGRCSLSLPGYAGKPSVAIFSQAKPALYDFELVKGSGGDYELRIR